MPILIGESVEAINRARDSLATAGSYDQALTEPSGLNATWVCLGPPMMFFKTLFTMSCQMSHPIY